MLCLCSTIIWLSTTKVKLEPYLRKQKHWQLAHTEYDLGSLAEKSMFSLFKHSTSEFHPLNHLYTCNRNERFSTLQKRGHNYITPAFKYGTTSKNFIFALIAFFPQPFCYVMLKASLVFLVLYF
jgi:hypothetical protein